MTKIHASSIVNSKAEIDSDVEIGPFCFIEENVKIGKGTRILNNVTIHPGAMIGENNIFYPGAVISGNPQDIKFKGEYTEVHIGNNNRIRECVTISRATKEKGSTIVGDNCLLMAYSHVAHDCIIGSNCIFANSVALGGHVEIEDFVILGGLVGVHQFVKIGKHTMIGAASMVVKDVPPYALFSGNPLNYEGLNIIGLRRRGFSNEAIEALKKAFTILYRSGLNVTQAINKIKEDSTLQLAEVSEVINFIGKSTRGLAK